MASNDQFLGNWPAAAPIHQTVTPQLPTPLAAIQGRNMEWVRYLYLCQFVELKSVTGFPLLLHR